MNLVQGAHVSEELIVIHHVDIKGQTKSEHEDFHYYEDFIEIYKPIIDKRAYTRTSGRKIRDRNTRGATWTRRETTSTGETPTR